MLSKRTMTQLTDLPANLPVPEDDGACDHLFALLLPSMDFPSILYGGAEFSRDIDFAILASEENLKQLKACLDELEAEVIAVPPFQR